MSPSLETGTVLDSSLSRYDRTDWGYKSVMSVPGKCDEKNRPALLFGVRFKLLNPHEQSRFNRRQRHQDLLRQRDQVRQPV